MAATASMRGTGTRAAFLDEAKKFAAGRAGEWLIRLIPSDWVRTAADKLPDSLLTDGDSRERWSAGIGLILDGLAGLSPGHRNAFQSFLEQSAEEIGKRRDELDGKGGDKDRAVIREAMKASERKLDPLREKQEQGDKVQKKSLPDYFTAKAAIKDQKIQKILTEIEARLPKDKLEAFLNRGGYRIQTTPEELISIAQASDPDDGHAYGVLRLLGLMNGVRGEGGIKAKVNDAVSDLMSEVVSGGDIKANLEKYSSKAETWAADSAAKRAKRKAV